MTKYQVDDDGVHSGFPLCEKLHFQMEKSNRTEYNYNLNVSHIMPCFKSFHVWGLGYSGKTTLHCDIFQYPCIID